MNVVYMIYCTDELYSVMGSEIEAEGYLVELRKVHPSDNWESRRVVIGRRADHKFGICWGSELIVDLVNLSVHQFSRAHWFLPIPPPDLPAVGVICYRYFVFHSTESGEMDAISEVRRALKGCQFVQIDISGTVKRIR